MRAIRHHSPSSTAASRSRIAPAHTGASASLPMLITRNVLPQIAQQPANASQVRDSDVAPSARVSAMPRGPVPFADAQRDLLGREAEEFLDLRQWRRFAEAIDADREAVGADETMPVVGGAGLDRNPPP